MKPANTEIERHYTRNGLFTEILRCLKAQGIDAGNVKRKDIAGVDEFHVGGAVVSAELAKKADLTQDSNVLDVGCGIGGPARMLADQFHCRVTGVDITAGYIRTASLLSELVGLQDRTKFIQADATAMPFGDNSFDFVWTQHAQMNIEKKIRLYSEIKRVLKKEGTFIYYDIFATGGGPVYYPVPWADSPAISHLITTKDLQSILTRLDFIEAETIDQTTAGAKFLEDLLGKIEAERPPAPGLQLIMGDSALEKLTNILRGIRDRGLVLQSGIYRMDV